jgi:hypothetical protein
MPVLILNSLWKGFPMISCGEVKETYVPNKEVLKENPSTGQQPHVHKFDEWLKMDLCQKKDMILSTPEIPYFSKESKSRILEW